MSKSKAKKYLLVSTIFITSVVFILQVSLFNFPQTVVEAAVNDQESGWDECKGWTHPAYRDNDTIKTIDGKKVGGMLLCRDRALTRAKNGNFYHPEMKPGLPNPPSGNKEATTPGTDRQWYNWGMTKTAKHFLSEGTSCGMGPRVCTPTPTPTKTPTLTPTTKPSVTPSLTPTSKPSVTPSLTPTSKPSVTPSLTPTSKPSVTPSLTPTSKPSVTPSLTPTTEPSPTPEVELCELGDRVVYDYNKNGLQDIYELGVKNIKVELYDEEMNKLGTQVTNSFGFYKFTELECEQNYYVKFYKPSNYKYSERFVGNNKEKDSNADLETGLSEKIYLTGKDYSIDALIYKEEVVITPTPTTPVVTPTPGVKGEDSVFGFNINKSIVGSSNYRIGELITYRVTVENSGTETVNKVTMRDIYSTNMRVEAIYLVQNGTRRNITSQFFANDSEMESGNILPRNPQDKTEKLDLTEITGDLKPGDSVTFEFIFKALTQNTQVCNQAFASANDRSEIPSQKVCVSVDAVVPVTD